MPTARHIVFVMLPRTDFRHWIRSPSKSEMRCPGILTPRCRRYRPRGEYSSFGRAQDVDLAVEMVPLRQLTKEQFDAVMRRWIHGRRRVQPGEPMLQFDVMPFLKSRNRS